MERVRQIDRNDSYPPVYFGTLGESLEARDEHIAATLVWAQQEAGPRWRLSYQILDRIEQVRASLRGISYINPGLAMVAVESVEHSPEEDEGLGSNQIMIKDATASKVVELPKGARLQIINEARTRLHLPQLDVSALKQLFWRGNVAIYNAYRNGRPDKSVLVYHDMGRRLT